MWQQWDKNHEKEKIVIEIYASIFIEFMEFINIRNIMRIQVISSNWNTDNLLLID